MKKISKKSLLQASSLSYKRQVWQDSVELRDLMEWSQQETEYRIIPPLPFKRPKKHYLSALMP